MIVRFFTLSIVFFLYTIRVCSQAPIVRQNGNTIAFYNNVPAAVGAANNGDTIYIPGGSWSISGDLHINKSIHIFGTGHHPDSSLPLGKTIFSGGSISLQQGCSNGSLWGISLHGSIYTPTGNDTIINYAVRRCFIQQSIQLSNFFSLGLFSENVIQGSVFVLNGNNSAFNNVFFNNIFESYIGAFGSGNIFKNNIFLYTGGTVSGSNYCVFENNIFFSNLFIGGSGFGTFNNNLFATTITFPVGSNVGNNNIGNQSPSSIFTNQTGSQFNYVHNYQLQPACPGNNAGTDGNDIGIYGGVFPWKDGSLPPNPHIQFKSIHNTTDPNGNLQINIKVKAQNN